MNNVKNAKNVKDLKMLSFKIMLLHKEAALEEALSVLTTANFGARSEVMIALRAKLHEVQSLIKEV